METQPENEQVREEGRFDMFICRTEEPVVKTRYGKLRGYFLDDIYVFLGVQYAQAKRFHMPEEAQSWDGVKDALNYGYVCRLMEEPRLYHSIRVRSMFWPSSEDCQYLNIWTPGLEKGARRPVMVWLHGGAFDTGSSIEHIAYDGENMSRYGDVVVVSLNHHLNILGYWDLSELGSDYWNTGNLGNADITAALHWIRENIEAFGGDPDNVTLFGQSGGGIKAWSLMQTPEANTLFHKAIILSGVAEEIFDSNPDANHAVIRELKRRNLDKGEILEAMPYEQLTAVYREISQQLAAEGYRVVRGPLENEYYLGNPIKRGFCKRGQQIPVMIGSVFSEFDESPEMLYKQTYQKEEIDRILEKRYPGASEKLISLYEKAYPDQHRLDLLVMDSYIRSEDIHFIRERCKSKESRTYSYLFHYEFALYNGIPGWHCSEIPFFFHNTDKIPVCRDSDDAKHLEEQIFTACMRFARTGKPEIPGIEWPECTPEKEHVMILDRTCEVRTNFDHELIRFHLENAVQNVPNA